MKIMTFNIQSGRNYLKGSVLEPDFSCRVIGKYMPDILGLNEVHDGGIYGNQVKYIAEKLGYPYYYFARAIEVEDSGYGNALVSKYPIKSAETIRIPDPLIKDEDAYYETRCILKAEIEIGKDHTVTVFVSHFGLANSEKKNAVATVCQQIGEESKRTVLMGDFNMHPDDLKLESIKERLTDTAIDENESYYTYIADKPREKIDYIWVSRDTMVINTQVIPEIGSDHRAYMTEVEFV